MWPIEARCASIANNYFTVAINRIGTVSAVWFNSFFCGVFVMKVCFQLSFLKFLTWEFFPVSEKIFFTTNRKSLKMSLHQEMANQVSACLFAMVPELI